MAAAFSASSLAFGVIASREIFPLGFELRFEPGFGLEGAGDFLVAGALVVDRHLGRQLYARRRSRFALAPLGLTFRQRFFGGVNAFPGFAQFFVAEGDDVIVQGVDHVAPAGRQLVVEFHAAHFFFEWLG